MVLELDIIVIRLVKYFLFAHFGILFFAMIVKVNFIAIIVKVNSNLG